MQSVQSRAVFVHGRLAFRISGVKMAAFEYHRPETVDEVLALLAERGDDGKILAGGQSLLAVMAMRLSTPAHVIDIGAIAGLAQISTDTTHLSCGALVRQSTAEIAPLVAKETPLVSRAFPWIGHRAIRNRGTVCGSLAHADPAAELPAVALALGAEFVLRSSTGTRTVAAADFFQGFLSTATADDELLIEVRFPRRAKTAGYAIDEISRRHGDFAMAGAAVALEFAADETIAVAAISLFSVSDTPVRASEAEQLMLGHKPSPGLFAEAAAAASKHINPSSDDHASGAYRRHIAGVLTKRCLVAATEDAGVAK